MLLLMIVWGWVASILTDIYSTPWLSITSLVMSLNKSLSAYNLKISCSDRCGFRKLFSFAACHPQNFQAMSLHKSFFVYNLKTVARVAADLEGYFLSFLISLKGLRGNILQGKRKSEEKLEAVLFFIQLYLLK